MRHAEAPVVFGGYPHQRRGSRFRHNHDGAALLIERDPSRSFRFLRLSLEEETFLHLGQVQVFV